MKKILGITFALLLVMTFSSCDQIINLIMPKVQMTITQPTGGYITVTPNKTEYTKGETVSIQATAITGYTFSSWTGGLVGTANPQSLTLNSDVTISAVFSAPLSAPTFSPAAGTVASGSTVTITTTTTGASIRYTTDGVSEPTATTGTLYSSAIPITATTTIKAVAVSGTQVSSVVSATYFVTASSVSAPTFSPAAGTYTAAQNVTISSSTSGAYIIYTTDGTTPSWYNGSIYNGAIPVSATTTIKAFAYKSGLTDSSVSSATFTINIAAVETPTIYPATQTFTSSSGIYVYMWTNTSGASIRYTTDGSTPSSTYGTVYSGSFAVTSTTTVKAIAYKSGMTDSGVRTEVFTYNQQYSAVVAPSFSPAPGYYSSSSTTWTGNVTLSTSTSGASIRYTTDGTTPSTTAGTLYSGAFAISGNTTVMAMAYKSGYTSSSVVYGYYYVPVATPEFSVAAGTYTSAQTVGITTDTAGASIRYTLDGTTPTSSSGTLYSAPIYISATKTLKAIAYKYNNYDSVVASATYTIGGNGTISGIVREATSPNGLLSGATLTLYNSANTSIGTTTSSSVGAFSFSVAAGTGYKVIATKSGYISEDYTGISVYTGTTNYLETIYMQSTASLPSPVSGYITNAATGYGESGVTVQLRLGAGNTTGTVVYTATTAGSSGLYSLSSVTAGTYTAMISKTGFTTSTFTITVLGGNVANPNKNSSINPATSTGALRFVLTWGASPYDLDSHIKVPTSSSYTHVYYGAKGNQSSDPYTTLDVDDTSSYGPETVTIYTQLSGTYTYYVHDFSNGGSSTSTALSSSGAQVKVYQGSTLLATYYVPSLGGTLWKVCSWNGYSLTPINSMLYETSASNVTNRSIIQKRNAPVVELP